MGAEMLCSATIGRVSVEGKALLETDGLIFRGGETRLSIPYKEIVRADAADGVLRVTWAGRRATFALGPAAEKWADRINNPPTRAHKLGIRLGQAVYIDGVSDPALAAEILKIGGHLPAGRGPVDLIFFEANERKALARLPMLRKRIPADGAIWVIRPKGAAGISEEDVMRAGKAAGLVDVKVVRFSDSQTAHRFVVPVAQR